MWRIFRKRFVIVQAVIVLVPAAAITVSLGFHQEQHRQEVARLAAAHRLAVAAEVARDQAEAIQITTAQRDAAQARSSELQQALDATTAERDKLKDQVAALQAVSYGLGAGPAAQTVSAAPGPVVFPYGYCTWWVATRRLITWRGNAIDWWWNARGIRPEGSQPQVGAIQVSRDSWWGHVALVEAVNGNGSWVVSEMNFVAWGYVDRRTVWPGGTLVGFIY